ncbi:MAG: ribonuclease HI [Treponema sp.]|jgi:ribonuclease HI|nr:ribonuclease HI [Treponema sp.]
MSEKESKWGWNMGNIGTELKIYTDGGCSGNPGPGGWAYVIEAVSVSGAGGASGGDRAGEFPGSAKIIAEKWGAESNTTNNRMELSAVIAALEALSGLALSPEKITVYTDSQYVQKGITQWIRLWKRNNWRTSGKDPVKNRELWQRLDELSTCFPLVWIWIKGHAGNKMNERCDMMTREAIASIV